MHQTPRIFTNSTNHDIVARKNYHRLIYFLFAILPLLFIFSFFQFLLFLLFFSPHLLQVPSFLFLLLFSETSQTNLPRLLFINFYFNKVYFLSAWNYLMEVNSQIKNSCYIVLDLVFSFDYRLMTSRHLKTYFFLKYSNSKTFISFYFFSGYPIMSVIYLI